MSEQAAVLIVEDDVSTQRLLAAVVRHLGMSPVVAADGRKALAAIAERAPAAIILDLLMPEVDGFEVLRQLREASPELLGRVIVVTAASIRDGDAHPDLQLVAKFFRKPIDIDELGAAVVDCVGRSKNAGRDGAYETPAQP